MEQNTNIIRKFLNQKGKWLALLVYIVSATAPFLLTIFFVRKTNQFCFIALIINVICLIFFILSMGVIRSKFRNKFYVKIFMLFSIAIVISYFASFKIQLCIADFIFIKSNEEKLNNFVKEINQYGKIKKFTDYYGKTLEINDLPDFDSNYYKNRNDSSYWNDIFYKYGIEPKMYYKFRDEINSMGFTRFCKTDNGIIYLQKGIDDDMYIIAYSPEGEELDGSGCYGFEVDLQKNSGNWFSPTWF